MESSPPSYYEKEPPPEDGGLIESIAFIILIVSVFISGYTFHEGDTAKFLSFTAIALLSCGWLFKAALTTDEDNNIL